MSFRKENVERQTAFRRAALANGYTPLANHHKHCYLKGWNDMIVDEDLIDTWSTKLVYQATGLRVENGLCALDLDIDDADMVQRIWDRAVGQFPQLQEALIRYGSGAKEAWFCRTDEPFSVIFSTLHCKPGQDPEVEGTPTYRMEAFGGGHPRQMGAFGAHTLKPGGDGFEIEYVWEGDESPAEVALEALPLVPKSAVLTIAQIVHDELTAAGWPRARNSRIGESDVVVAYDLTDKMLFDCLDGVQRTLGQLADYATGNANARCSASWIDPTFINRTRCLVGVDHNGTVSVLETANWTRHLPAEAADKPLSERMDALREKLEEVGIEFDTDEYPDAPASFQDIVIKLLEEWAWCGPHQRPCLSVRGHPDQGMTLGNFRITHMRHAYEREGPRGGVKKISPVDAWVAHPQRQDVDGYRFMPNKPPGIYSTDGVRAINSYHAPAHVVVDDPVEREKYITLWNDFMRHLLPDEEERLWFKRWLAYKRQNLTMPGVAVIMYARHFGVGRGTLFDILGGVFGDRYVSSVSSEMLMGQTSQSQYTEWMANTLIVTTDEVLPDGEEGTNMLWRRKKAYEKLKERIDPKPRRMQIVCKGTPNYDDWVFTSFLLATNHDNAIPVPKGDRRLTVLTNASPPLIQNKELFARINEQRNPDLNPRFVSVLNDHLLSYDVGDFTSQIAPTFSGKTLMQEANLTELDGIIDDVLENMPNDWVALDIVLDRVDSVLRQKGLRDDFPHWRKMATDRAKSQWTYVGRAYLDRNRTTKRMVLARTTAAEEEYKQLTAEERVQAYADMANPDSVASAKLRGLRAGISEV